MSIAKSVELSSTSTKSFEDAIRTGLERANRTLDEIKQAWIKDQVITYSNGQISEFKVHMKVTFVVKE